MNKMMKSQMLGLARAITLFGGSAALLALSGCATQSKVVTADTEAYASQVIAEKVGIAADAQRTYLALVAEDRAVMLAKQAALLSDEIDVDYIGQAPELLQSFAYRYGYKYAESGKRVAIAPINIRVVKQSPVEVLRSIGNQIHASADVELDQNSNPKTLRLVFKPIANQKG